MKKVIRLTENDLTNIVKRVINENSIPENIKKFVYRKFDELEVYESDNRNDIYLHYISDIYAEILILVNTGIVFYDVKFSNEILDKIGLKETDFKKLLKKWVEDTFQIKVIDTRGENFNWAGGIRIEYDTDDTDDTDDTFE